MKKIVALVVVLLFVSISIAQAAGTCTVAYTNPTRSVRLATVTCTAASDDATYPSTTILLGTGWIYLAETNPGSTGPTDNYDMVVNNTAGVDVMGGALMNRDISNTERATPALSGWVDGPLTLVVTNNAVNSATFVLKLWSYQAE
jgi:hypothetical protein